MAELPPAEHDADAEEAEALDAFAASMSQALEGLFERLSRYLSPEEGSGEAAAYQYLRERLHEAFVRPGGLAALATDMPRPLVGESQRDAFLRGVEDYLHAALFLLRDHAFTYYAQAPEQCRLIIDLLHAIVHRFHRHLNEAVASPADAAAPSADIRDPVTGLPGLRRVLAMLDDLISAHHEGDAGLAIAAIEIEFSEAASPAGTLEDDRRSLGIAKRIGDALRQADYLGRLDRDNYVVLLGDIASAEVALLAAYKIKAAIETELVIGDLALTPRAIIGVAAYPDHAPDSAELLQFAEVAREAARGLPDAVSLYDPEAHRETRRRQSLESRLRTALHENQLELYLQPKAELSSGRIFGAEALLRWHLDGETWIPPGEIVALAEHSRQQSALSLWVINSALRQLSILRRDGIAIEISINITAQNLLDPELADFIEQSLRTWQLTPQDVVIELTENAMIGDSERAIECLQRLKTLGLRLSIDDFGTGYSSLAYLTRMPIDELKIDQAFTQRMLQVKQDERIVRSIIDLARHFDLKVVAEGVEDMETAESLRKLGCEAIQGYLLSRPIPPDEFASWWLSRKGHASELSTRGSKATL